MAFDDRLDVTPEGGELLVASTEAERIAVGELPRQEPVPGDERAEAGEVGVGGVGRQDQDGERRELEDVVEEGAVAPPRRAERRQQRLLFGVDDRLEPLRQQRQSHVAVGRF